MDFDDKTVLIQVITRPGMFVPIVDRYTLTSFIHGYELGKKTCPFSDLLKQDIAQNRGIEYRSDGLPGQLERLSEKLKLSWSATFRRTALHLIMESDVDNIAPELTETTRTRILSLIERIISDKNDVFHESTMEDWASLCLIDHDWFLRLFDANELKMIRQIETKAKS